MSATAGFFLQNIVYVYFFYGLAFFALGLMAFLETTRGSEFRFARALWPLAIFALLHGAHEWFEMFQIFAAAESGHTPGMWEEIFRLALLAVSFLALVAFGVRLLPDAEQHPRVTIYRVLAIGAIWLIGVLLIAWRYGPPFAAWLDAADVLARYSLAIPAGFLAAWALLRERRDFHARGMSAYGQDLLWAALAFFIYGTISQIFTRPSLLFPSQYINTTLFLRTFGIPVQLLRALAAIAILIFLGRALRAFDLESRIRLARANKARLEAQAATLTAQAQRVAETEALNAQLAATARELSAMLSMARILSSTVDQERLLADGLYQVVHSFESAYCSVIFLKRPDGGLELAGKYRRPEGPEPLILPPITLAVKAAIETEHSVGAGLDGEVVKLDDLVLSGAHSFRTLAVPLHAKGQLFGSLALSALPEQQPFRRAELNLLMAFGQQLAASVENADLYRTLRERESQLEDLVHELVNAQENERARIARELHDETGQKLSALVMGLAAVQSLVGVDPVKAGRTLQELREMAENSIDELRNIMANLRPSQLDDLGLVPALRWYGQQYAARYPGITLNLALERSGRRLRPEYETILFRVTQEALTNVARHARATCVDVELSYLPQSVRLRIIDNGVGFEEEALPRRRDGGWGLVGIRERAAQVAGRCEITSHPGAGTCVAVELPLEDGGQTQA